MTEKSNQKDKEKVEDRRDAGIARMLKTPRKPHKDMKKGNRRLHKVEPPLSAKTDFLSVCLAGFRLHH